MARIADLKQTKKFKNLNRTWFIKTDQTKIHRKSGDDEWKEHLGELEKFRVHKIMLSYVAKNFPGKEEEFQRIGLIKKEEESDIDLLNENNEANLFAEFI